MNDPLPLPVSANPQGASRGLVAGFSAFMVGLKLVLPGGGLFRYALAPVIVSAIVLVLVAIGAFFGTTYLLLGWVDESWIGWLGGVLAFVLTLLLAYFLFVPVMAVFAPLFIDPICERVYTRYTGRQMVDSKSAGSFLKRQISALLQGLKWTVVMLFIQIPLTIGAMITGVLAIAAIPVGAALMGVDLLDYPLAIREYKLRAKLAWARQNFWPVAGMGAGASLFLLVPVVNLFVVPAGAAAATILLVASESSSAETAEHS